MSGQSPSFRNSAFSHLTIYFLAPSPSLAPSMASADTMSMVGNYRGGNRLRTQIHAIGAFHSRRNLRGEIAHRRASMLQLLAVAGAAATSSHCVIIEEDSGSDLCEDDIEELDVHPSISHPVSASHHHNSRSTSLALLVNLYCPSSFAIVISANCCYFYRERGSPRPTPRLSPAMRSASTRA